MATGLENYPNIEPADSDYPNGNIKDKDISLPGTPVNQLVYADIHQTFAKLLRMVDITANILPDNEYNGFQYIEALRYLFLRNFRFKELDTYDAGITAESDYNTKVIVKPTCGAGCFVTMVEPTGSYDGKVTIANYSNNTVNVFSIMGGDIDGAPEPFVLPVGDYVELNYDSIAGEWSIPIYNKLEL